MPFGVNVFHSDGTWIPVFLPPAFLNRVNNETEHSWPRTELILSNILSEKRNGPKFGIIFERLTSFRNKAMNERTGSWRWVGYRPLNIALFLQAWFPCSGCLFRHNSGLMLETGSGLRGWEQIKPEVSHIPAPWGGQAATVSLLEKLSSKDVSVTSRWSQRQKTKQMGQGSHGARSLCSPSLSLRGKALTECPQLCVTSLQLSVSG